VSLSGTLHTQSIWAGHGSKVSPVSISNFSLQLVGAVLARF
jgi:hypothetical protein